MARQFFTARTGQLSVLASEDYTLMQLTAPSNIGVAILEVHVYIRGTVTTGAKWDVQLLRQTDAGSGGVSVTPVKIDKDVSDAIQSTVTKGPYNTDQPVASDILEEWNIHPQDGIILPFTATVEHIVRGGDRVGIRIPNAEDALSVLAMMKCEE